VAKDRNPETGGQMRTQPYALQSGGLNVSLKARARPAAEKKGNSSGGRQDASI